MHLQPVEICRDEFGYFTHPELPEWDESTKIEEINAWFASKDARYHIDYLEWSGDEVAIAQYFEQGDPDFSGWHPEAPNDTAVLLAIFDTENGPQAVWAVQCDQVS
ncbi:TPA: hypothetical protein ACX6RA_003547 [Photobacterium damselae]